MAKTFTDFFSRDIKVLGKHRNNSCSYILVLTYWKYYVEEGIGTFAYFLPMVTEEWSEPCVVSFQKGLAFLA